MDLQIIVVLLTAMVISSVESSVVESKYRRVTGSDVIQGPLVEDVSTRSVLECSNRCLTSTTCVAYEYNEKTLNRSKNCVLIGVKNDNDTNPGEQRNFTSSGETRVYRKDYCATSPCQNGGACINEADGYRCECPSGFKGANCTNVDHCAGDPCQNGGTCINDADGYICQCRSGSAVHLCYNGGTCGDSPGSFTCNCTANYEGLTCQLNCTHPWCTVVPWPPGDTPKLHIPFKFLSDFITHNSPGFFTGKVDLAIRLIRQQRQWLDLGDVSGYSCISRPETCGPNGASLTAWIRLIDCPEDSGFITSQGSWGTTGFRIDCFDNYLGYILQMTDYNYGLIVLGKPAGWLHLTIIYHGTGNGTGSGTGNDKGMSVYYGGIPIPKDNTKQITSPIPTSSGQIVIGRSTFNYDGAYATMEIDELTLWNN